MSNPSPNPTINLKTTCPYCENIVDDLKNHLKSGKNEQIFQCDTCDLSVYNKKNCLDDHQNHVHYSSIEPISCDKCYVDFSSSRYLELHEKICQNTSEIEEPT